MVALVGLPGSGKSTVGRGLARRLDCDFIDSDDRIEQHIGCSIRSFFEMHGEAAFRDIEEAVLAQLLASDGRFVLATGGGAVLRPANRERLRSAATVIYLRCTPEEVFARLRHDRKRPLLQVEQPLERLRELHAARHPLYAEVAHLQIDTGRPNVKSLVDAVLARLRQVPARRT